MTLETARARPVALALSLAVGVLALVIAVFAEILLAMPLPVWFYALSRLLVILPVVIRPSRLTAFVAVILVVALTVLRLVPWTSRKPFLGQLNKIQTGMTETQVRAIMVGYKEGTGWPTAPGSRSPAGTNTNGQLAVANSLVFRHSDDGRFNSDWGVVEFKDGRAIRVQFMPD